jgi:hypothetical protein
VTGGVGISENLHVGNTINAGSTIATTSSIQTMTGSAPAAGGIQCITLTSSNVGIFVGTGAPSFAAPKGSLYINTTGGASTLLYVCKTANTATAGSWSAVTSS